MTWEVYLSTEVQGWYDHLRPEDRRRADDRFAMLAEHGNRLRMPYSRSLDCGLFELRFNLEGVARRITYTFDPDQNAITLTTFRKQRQRESREVDRARAALKDLHATTDPMQNTTRWRPPQ